MVDIRGSEWETVASDPLFQRLCGSLFWSFKISLCKVLLKSIWTTLEPHFIRSEGSHMFFKIKQKLHANVPKGAFNNCFGAPFWEFPADLWILISTPVCEAGYSTLVHIKTKVKEYTGCWEWHEISSDQHALKMFKTSWTYARSVVPLSSICGVCFA